MSIKYIKTMECVCEKCGHSWKTRTEEVPKVCSKCKRKDWNDVEGQLEAIDESAKERAQDWRPQEIREAESKVYQAVPMDDDWKSMIDVDETDVEELVVDENVDFGS